jgi:hypothetical protein
VQLGVGLHFFSFLSPIKDSSAPSLLNPWDIGLEIGTYLDLLSQTVI